MAIDYSTADKAQIEKNKQTTDNLKTGEGTTGIGHIDKNNVQYNLKVFLDALQSGAGGDASFRTGQSITTTGFKDKLGNDNTNLNLNIYDIIAVDDLLADLDSIKVSKVDTQTTLTATDETLTTWLRLDPTNGIQINEEHTPQYDNSIMTKKDVQDALPDVSDRMFNLLNDDTEVTNNKFSSTYFSVGASGNLEVKDGYNELLLTTEKTFVNAINENKTNIDINKGNIEAIQGTIAGLVDYKRKLQAFTGNTTDEIVIDKWDDTTYYYDGWDVANDAIATVNKTTGVIEIKDVGLIFDFKLKEYFNQGSAPAGTYTRTMKLYEMVGETPTPSTDTLLKTSSQSIRFENVGSLDTKEVELEFAFTTTFDTVKVYVTVQVDTTGLNILDSSSFTFIAANKGNITAGNIDSSLVTDSVETGANTGINPRFRNIENNFLNVQTEFDNIDTKFENYYSKTETYSKTEVDSELDLKVDETYISNNNISAITNGGTSIVLQANDTNTSIVNSVFVNNNINGVTLRYYDGTIDRTVRINAEGMEINSAPEYTPTKDNQFATKKYVDDNAGGGTGGGYDETVLCSNTTFGNNTLSESFFNFEQIYIVFNGSATSGTSSSTIVRSTDIIATTNNTYIGVLCPVIKSGTNSYQPGVRFSSETSVYVTQSYTAFQSFKIVGLFRKAGK